MSRMTLLVETNGGSLFEAVKDMPGGHWSQYRSIDNEIGAALGGTQNTDASGLRSSGGAGAVHVTRGTTDWAGLNGRLFLAERTAAMTWDASWTDLTGRIGQPVGGNLLSQCVASSQVTSLGVHCLVVATPFQGGGTVWHTVRQQGHWQGWGNVNDQVHLHFPGHAEIAAAMVLSELHVVVAYDRHVWVLVRQPNGPWKQPFEVTAHVPLPRGQDIIPLPGVFATGASSELHIAVTTGGGTQHIIRGHDGSLQPFWGNLSEALQWRYGYVTSLTSYGGDVYGIFRSNRINYFRRHFSDGSWEQQDLSGIHGLTGQIARATLTCE